MPRDRAVCCYAQRTALLNECKVYLPVPFSLIYNPHCFGGLQRMLTMLHCRFDRVDWITKMVSIILLLFLHGWNTPYIRSFHPNPLWKEYSPNTKHLHSPSNATRNPISCGRVRATLWGALNARWVVGVMRVIKYLPLDVWYLLLSFCYHCDQQGWLVSVFSDWCYVVSNFVSDWCWDGKRFRFKLFLMWCLLGFRPALNGNKLCLQSA